MCLSAFSHSYIQDEVIARVVIKKPVHWGESRMFLFLSQASGVELAAVNIASLGGLSIFYLLCKTRLLICKQQSLCLYPLWLVSASGVAVQVEVSTTYCQWV